MRFTRSDELDRSFTLAFLAIHFFTAGPFSFLIGFALRYYAFSLEATGQSFACSSCPFVLATVMQVVIDVIIGFYIFGIVADLGHRLLNADVRGRIFVVSDGEGLAVPIPGSVTGAGFFRGFFNGDLAGRAFAPDLDLVFFGLRSTAAGQNQKQEAEKREWEQVHCFRFTNDGTDGK